MWFNAIFNATPTKSYEKRREKIRSTYFVLMKKRWFLGAYRKIRETKGNEENYFLIPAHQLVQIRTTTFM